MTDKERLVELMFSYQEEHDSIVVDKLGLADHLIANGVVVQKQGEWLIGSDGYYPYCSECKEEPKGGNMTTYCPSCGAKMVKEA